jgi:hypothetical protein
MKTRISEIDTTFVEHSDAFSVDNIGAYNFDKAFHVIYGPLTGGPLNHLQTDDNLNCVVTLFFKGGRYPQDAFDTSMDLANKIRLNAMKPANAMTNEFIKNVVCRTINIDPLNTNDNAIIITLEFDVRYVYGTDSDLT